MLVVVTMSGFGWRMVMIVAVVRMVMIVTIMSMGMRVSMIVTVAMSVMGMVKCHYSNKVDH